MNFESTTGYINIPDKNVVFTRLEEEGAGAGGADTLGGIDANNYLDFLKLPNVACVGGSWVCPTRMVQNQDWGQISQLAADVRSALE